MLPVIEGRMIRMHRQLVENFLDTNHIPWVADCENTPFMAVFVDDHAGTHVVWPFRLTRALPNQVMSQCSFEEVCTVPSGTDFVLYGG